MPGINRNLIGDTSGGISTAAHTTVAVGLTSTAVVASNPNRKYLLLQNDSDTVIYIKLGAAAVVNQGIRLDINGGKIEFSHKNGNLYTGAINGIFTGTGTKNLLVTEGS